MGTFFAVLLCLVSLFLILLVLVQRGRGGGLAGALGGMGGQSAFGAKAGDVFTRITIVTATVWVLLCMATLKFGAGGGSQLKFGNSQQTSPLDLGTEAEDEPKGPTNSGPAEAEPDAAPKGE